MKNTYDQLCALFTEWAARMQKDGIDRFTKDGVHYRHPDKQERYNRWDAAEKKILFIGKEPNGDPRDIAEHWSSDPLYNVLEKPDKYAVCQYLYITSICKNRPDFQTLDISPDSIKETFLKTPFCWINVKKSAGGSTAKINEIGEHFEKYGDLLARQLDILKPTDVVCLCGALNGGIIEKLKSTTICKPNFYTAKHPAFRRSRETKYQSLTLR